MFRFSVLIFLLAFTTTSDEGQMAWDEDYRLQWSDFQGSPNDASDAVAITASGLSSSFSARTTATRLVDYSATITAHFYPEKSWFKPNKVDEVVLAHEQLHFDITELHARKLRRDIHAFSFSLNIKKEMGYLQDKINRELEAMQEQYDSQTNYSINVETQKKWQIYIREELNKLKNYK